MPQRGHPTVWRACAEPAPMPAPAGATLSASMDPHSQRVMPLHVASASDFSSQEQARARMSDQVDVAKILVERGADLNAVAHYRGLDDVTPLRCACWSSRNLLLV